MRLTLLATVALLAGSVSPPLQTQNGGNAPTASDWDAIEAAIGAPIGQGQGHDHADPKQHAHAYNLQRVAALNGPAGRQPQPTEGYVETAIQGNYAYLCRTGPDQGLVIFDVSDIENPKQVGYVKLDAGFEPDVEVSSDGNWAFWETQRFPTSAETPSLLEPGANLPHGVHIVDVRDKAHPKWVGFSPTLPDGPHSITYANIAGRHILFQSVYAFAYAYGDVEVPTTQRL